MNLTITQKDRYELKKISLFFTKDKSYEEIFYNLCFCLCAPQTKFSSNLKVIQQLKDNSFCSYKHINFNKLKRILKPVRFYNNKARYLLEAKYKFWDILYKIRTMNSNNSPDVRNFLVNNVKGLGMKTSSHFLRNCGATNLAIIDTHILKFLKYPKKTLSKNEYIALEDKFRQISHKHYLTVSELDALVWQRYSNTKWEDFKY